MAVEDILNGRDWDVLLPPQCRGCMEANCELNSGQELLGKLLGSAAVNEASAKMIQYVEANCPGLTNPDDPKSCASFPQILLTNFIQPPPAPVDIVDR